LPAEVWAHLFAPLGSLRVLNLGGNNLNELPAEAWANLTNALAGLGTLLSLSLGGNDLSEWPAICWIIVCWW